MYEVKIVQTIGHGMSKDTSLKVYLETVEALMEKQGDAPEVALKNPLQAGVAFLKDRGIAVEWRREK